MFKFSKKSKQRMEGVHPELIAVFEEAIKRSPIDFGIPEHGGVRKDEEQNELFLQGKSKVDGFERKGKHQIQSDGFGHALDVFAYVAGKASWSKVHLGIIAGVILSTAKEMKNAGKISINLRWGGTFGSDEFNGWDFPHFEIH